ncbi:MAG: DUF2238 domain-containing protein [Candidatus Nanoarchaeia archaeon]
MYSDKGVQNSIFLVAFFTLFMILIIGLKLSLSGSVGWGDLALADQLMAFLILGIGYRYRHHLTTNTIGVGCLFLIVHELGSVMLYGTMLGPLRYDKVMHFFGGFVLVFIFYNLFTNNFTDGEHHHLILPLCILCALGIGAITEIIEYIVGFQINGAGSGFFAYGVGDFGEWNDTIWDMASNLLGTLSGSITTLLIKK